MAYAPSPAECTLGDNLKIKRLVSGLWQVSGGHGEIETESALSGMQALYDAGLTSFDMADHYGPAELLAGGKVAISGFGTFEARRRKARTGRNPHTGEALDIPASRAPAFKAGKPLKETLNP